jgi:hypothetical protein
MPGAISPSLRLLGAPFFRAETSPLLAIEFLSYSIWCGHNVTFFVFMRCRWKRPTKKFSPLVKFIKEDNYLKEILRVSSYLGEFGMDLGLPNIFAGSMLEVLALDCEVLERFSNEL